MLPGLRSLFVQYRKRDILILHESPREAVRVDGWAYKAHILTPESEVCVPILLVLDC